MNDKIVNRMALASLLALTLAVSRVLGVDLPVHLNFNIGFDLRVVPAPGDASRAHCLGVSVDRIRTDKTRTLAITGTITNYSGIPCEGIAMRFAVTSHVGIGKSLGVATVTPNCIPPGGSAVFTLHLTLDSPRPRFAMYTVTAGSPALCDWKGKP